MKRSVAFPVLVLAAALAVGGCELDLNDPANPTEEEVFESTEGIMAVAVGLQAEYGNQIVDPLYVVGLVTDEIGVPPTALASYKTVGAGGELDNTFGPVSSPWSGQYRVIKLADDLLRSVPDSELGPGTRSGMLAMAELFKAMAFGHLSQLYAEAPLEVGPDNPYPSFASSTEILREVLNLLEGARARITETPPSEEFTERVLAPGFDLANTIDAMTARYALLAGDLERALEAAQRVDRSVLSELRYSDTDVNPLYALWYASGNGYQMRPKQAFRTEAEPGDDRVAYWVTPDSIAGETTTLDELARYREPSDPIPLYLPDEMRLIQAEVYARTNRLAEARTALNEVRTQCSSPVDEPVACLGALDATDLPDQQSILDEIYRQRRYELFLQGVRWSDQRRFGVEPKYDVLPTPFGECDNNPNAPC